MLKSFWCLLLLVLIVTACVPTSANKDADKKYFDIAALIHQQIGELSKRKPKVEKNILLGGTKDQISTDTLDWGKELALFKEADINSPSLRDSYEIDDDKPNQTITYTAKEDKLKVREIKLQYNENSQIADLKINQVKIVFTDDNQLYEIQRVMEMSLKDNLLSNYAIKGFQKVAMKDSLVYRIEGKIVR
jgi:hypothetical protein